VVTLRRIDRVHERDLGGLECRRDPEQHADDHRGHGAEDDDSTVEGERQRAGEQTSGNECWRRGDDGGTHQHPECAAHTGQHEALREELTDDASSPRPERRAHRQFARAHAAAGEQQVGNVRAADEQHDPNDAEEEH
jgi:hypothetical protein